MKKRKLLLMLMCAYCITIESSYAQSDKLPESPLVVYPFAEMPKELNNEDPRDIAIKQVYEKFPEDLRTRIFNLKRLDMIDIESKGNFDIMIEYAKSENIINTVKDSLNNTFNSILLTKIIKDKPGHIRFKAKIVRTNYYTATEREFVLPYGLIDTDNYWMKEIDSLARNMVGDLIANHSNNPKVDSLLKPVMIDTTKIVESVPASNSSQIFEENQKVNHNQSSTHNSNADSGVRNVLKRSFYPAFIVSVISGAIWEIEDYKAVQAIRDYTDSNSISSVQKYRVDVEKYQKCRNRARTVTICSMGLAAFTSYFKFFSRRRNSTKEFNSLENRTIKLICMPANNTVKINLVYQF